VSIAGYREFLEAKVCAAPSYGFAVDQDQVSTGLPPMNRAIVPWLLRGGRRALFAAFGLHKTVTGLEAVRLAAEFAGGRGLIVCPLGVRQEFVGQSQRHLQWPEPPRFIRSIDEADPTGVYLTNYETVRDGKLDPMEFQAAWLDEASILRGFGGTKTFREFMRLFADDEGGTGEMGGGVPYRFVATATPSPNEYIELLAYAAYLGIMSVSEAKTRFFKRDSTQADRLTLHPHKRREFWLWVFSWALFVQKPSDLGFSDEGYDLPIPDVRWHELPSDHRQAGTDPDGQAQMFQDAAIGVVGAAKVKRETLPARVEAMVHILTDRSTQQAGQQWVIWCDLNDEQRAVERALESVGLRHSSIYGSLTTEECEARLEAWRDRETDGLISKPVMLGSGPNLQQCNRALYLGIGFKFNDFIQAFHRIYRFGQKLPIRIDILYTEAEREVRRTLERKWQEHNVLVAEMTAIVREFGLDQSGMAASLARAMEVERQEITGPGYRLVNGDAIEEARTLDANSVDLIVTSIPFSTQYEYTPSYRDLGHTDDDEHFFEHLAYLTPELLRVLKPGRVAAVHVKDRIVPGGLSGLGFQTVSPFSDYTVAHFRKHGFAFLARKTIATDVVRENNQTYRLGWTEQCKDGSRMGAGMPEYVLLFRKPPSDNSNGYADDPVVKEKPLCDDHGTPAPFDSRTNWKRPVPGTGYSRSRWQLDAHGVTRSSGDRLLSSSEILALPHDQLFKLWRERSLNSVYDFAGHLAVAEELDHAQRLPATFMLLPPHSVHPDVWTDITRMRTLNGAQSAKGKEMHLCPLQFDIVDRLILQLSQPGETVFDPFGGLMTVPYCALKLGRRGLGFELNARYFADGAVYCAAAAHKVDLPSLFDLVNVEQSTVEVSA
jgi:DNA modification methylase